MIVFLLTLMAWAIVTVVGQARWLKEIQRGQNRPSWDIVAFMGHWSWVGTSRLLRSVFGERELGYFFPCESDEVVFNRILADLYRRGLVDREEAHSLWQRANQIPLQISPEHVEEDQPLVVATSAEKKLSSADQTPTLHDVNSMTGFPAAVVPQPLEATQTDAVSSPPTTTPQTPPLPKQSWAAVIESFLAVHNIRWGELVSGLLIVVCSIGLVISLWNTLISTHRIVPTLVFLAANAAIFAAGFYTLAKWRLRHTSHAVLMIATLLVPLSMLAGLAAAGQSGASLSLSNLPTLGAMLLVAVVDVVLLLRAGRALYGVSKEKSFALAVAAPTLLIPSIPVALENFGTTAGFIVVIASLPVMLAIVWFQRPWRFNASASSRHEDEKEGSQQFAGKSIIVRPMLTAVSRHQWTFLGVAIFSLAVFAVSVAMLGRAFEAELWLAVTASTLPALIAAAVAAHWTGLHSRLAHHRFIGNTVTVLGTGLPFVLLPLFSLDPKWLWCWAAAISVSSSALWTAYRRGPWLAVAFAPIGVATVLSSTTVVGQIDWESVSWTRRVLGGEPMMAGLLLAAVTAVAAGVFRRTESKRPLLALTAAWLAWASTIAAVLPFMQPSCAALCPNQR